MVFVNLSATLIVATISATLNASATNQCTVEIHVLGIGQDAGIPQIGRADDPAWDNPAQRRMATSLALVDQRSGKRYLFEATPDIRDQLRKLDSTVAPKVGSLGLSGIFLTHAHIGHYAGLMFLGRESAGTTKVPVYAMPRMQSFLEQNGPWSQLISLGNIVISPINADHDIQLANDLIVSPFIVPHRDEYSETIGYRITGPTKSVFFVPDIDDWESLESLSGKTLKEILAGSDYAFLDATFFDDNELPGRDMSKIPHPRVPDTMARLSSLSREQKKGVHFIHFNHTNALRNPSSAASYFVRNAGFSIAEENSVFCLSKE